MSVAYDDRPAACHRQIEPCEVAGCHNAAITTGWHPGARRRIGVCDEHEPVAEELELTAAPPSPE